MKFKGDQLTFQTGFGEYRYTIKLNPNTRLKQMDWMPPDSHSTIKGLYQLEQDSLKIALPHSPNRPKDLSGDGATRVYILKRIKP
jgi:uncharacterized protein (TIGR03067 family)